MSAQTLPVDNTVVTGKLDNGITYYIKHNTSPRGQVSYHLAYNIGALAEDDGEYGLAHFLEHMTFQGTKHFPAERLMEMLESNGVIYGYDINAVTSENHTIYTLDGIPSRNSALLDSCMMVMADWSHALTLDDKYIDKERTVIIEEIKMRNTPQYIMQAKWASEMLKGSRYVDHDIIGKEDFIASFPAERLRQFYRKWHRPDLEALIIVGDIDVKDMEQRITRIMNNVPKADGECPLKSPYQFCTVADHDTLRFCDAHLEGANSRSVIVINRITETPIAEKNTEEYMRLNVIVRLFNILAAQRANDKSKEQGSPLGSCGISIIPLKRGYYTYQLGASLRSDDEARALRMLMLEGERLRQVGFTPKEMEFGKKLLMKEMETAYKYTIIPNEKICSSIEESWLNGEPLLSNEQYYKVCSKILNSLTLEQLNDMVKSWSSGKNRTVVVTGPPAEYPLTAEDATDIICKTEQMDYSAYPYVMPDEPQKTQFVTELPAKGTVKKMIKEGNFGTEEWTLSNGVKVIYKNVVEDKGKVCLRAVRRGGRSLYDIEMLPAAEQAGAWVMSCGGGSFNSKGMYEQIRLHGIQFSPSVNLYSSQMVGKASPDEAEALFQLTHIMFTKPKLDSELLKMVAMQMRMTERGNAVNDTVRMMRSNYSPRTLLRNSDYYEKATPNRIIKVWKECFGDPTKFTFVLTGNITKEEAIDLCEKYIASMQKPKDSKKGKSIWVDNGIRSLKGNMTRKLEMYLGRDLASVVVCYNMDGKPSLKDLVSCELLKHIYQTRCMQNIREKEGGVYRINVVAETNTVPMSEYRISAEFSCSPEDAEKLKGKLIAEWERMVKEGVSELEYNTVERYFTKKMIEKGDDAEEWSKALAMRLLSDSETLNSDTYANVINSMSKADVNDFMRRMDKDGGRLDVTFLSKK